MSSAPVDLIVRAGRVFCAASGLDGPGAVAIRGDRIVGVGAQLNTQAITELNFPDALLLPGLVDMHAHPDRGFSRYGVDPDIHFLPRGVTTVLSQGDVGANDWLAYRDQVIRTCRTRVLLALNLSSIGESHPQYCFPTLDVADVNACVRTIETADASIWGIAVNTGPSNPTPAPEILNRGITAATHTGKPLLIGTRLLEDWTLDDQLPLVRPGDVVTYCLNNSPESIVRDGKIRQAVWTARERGVLFDVGHGMQSFNFSVAAAAIADGFFPDTISTDQYNKHIDSIPQHDLPRTLSKLIAVGMPEQEAFTRVTARPAALLGLQEEIGTLRPGACADLAILQWNATALPLQDVHGNKHPGGCWEPITTVRAGEIIVPVT